MQQLFSSEKIFTVTCLVGAFEQFLNQWDCLARDPKYLMIATAIQAGINLMQSYYDKTDCSVVAALSTGMSGPYLRLNN
jgi:hypothetical protein